MKGRWGSRSGADGGEQTEGGRRRGQTEGGSRDRAVGIGQSGEAAED